ncbi:MULTISPECIES: IclR family transcriptional regulator domain-containing protein [Roseateles]|uniref:IclR family transcriptional regulator domain-containing protein n=1 Tax=Roseateles TaxID=93681 RepID=UPI0014951D33|nr:MULTISPECIES: IclR family transcriptional regulator C-terminal domain-containing protein [Roseateles]WIV97372.1 IclR family transcriptional regulator C-terminal domain-containing protein [Paucibacter aquatile]
MSAARAFEDLTALAVPALTEPSLDKGALPAVAKSDSKPANDGPLKRDLVAGLEKGLAVIEAFDQERPRLTISEVAGRTGLTRAAARRYLLTLTHLGFVTQDRKMFALSPKVLRLGQSYMHSARLPRIVEPELHKLAYALKEASSAGVLDGGDVICIAATSAGRVVSPTLQPGARVPAYCAANGRVMLAALPQAEVDDWIARQQLTPLTPHTITHPERLRIEIARARALGYACIDQELELGLRTVAVPLRNYRGDVVAAMNISVHASRMSMDQMVEHCLPPLLQAQAHLRMLL